ncbi:hypothetical protein [Chengkuizengella axinellae]|uniref:DUF4280 domain-containing protein n=1 Tax=Chengkuizengella axinellae TaxID=3064388 RepID=A0ABT9J1C2_9BACL|nr:hypothetical protein [Chengkuizengella sp. 2205SS18-9]MDP5275278.1 hypothetical protein [Chengkuizengella sp. 2205SS18-9]
MGYFQENVCDCCLCPLQCAIKQFEGENITFFYGITNLTLIGISVEDFIVSGINSSNGLPSCAPVSQILAFQPDNPKPQSDLVKPIQKSVKGECACIEDPITNKFKVGDIVTISTLGPVQVTAVGEGIVVTNDDSGDQFIFSTCSGVSIVIFNSSDTTTNQAAIKQDIKSNWDKESRIFNQANTQSKTQSLHSKNGIVLFY